MSENEGQRIPSLHVSTSRTRDGRVTLTLCHLDPATAAELERVLPGMQPTSVSGRILTATLPSSSVLLLEVH